MNGFDSESFIADRMFMHTFSVGVAGFIQKSDVQHLFQADTTCSADVQ